MSGPEIYNRFPILSKFISQKGAVLLLAFIIMVTLTVVAAAYMFLVSANTRLLGGQQNNVKAFYLAEAGLNKAVHYLLNTAPDGSTDGSWRTTAYPAAPGVNPTDPKQENLGEGAYTIWVVDSGSDVLMTSRGTVNGISRVLNQIVAVDDNETCDLPEVFEQPVYIGGDFDLGNGNGAVINGDVQAGGNINTGGGTINGDENDNDPLTFPTIDFDAYEAIADTVINGNYTFSANDTESGIWFVDGDVTLDQGVTITGSLIVTGNITGANIKDLTVTATAPNPAIIAGGNFVANNFKDADITGIIIVEGNFTIANALGGNFNGGIFTGGNLEFQNGNGITIDYTDLSTNPPPNISDPTCVSGGVTIDPVANSWGEG